MGADWNRKDEAVRIEYEIYKKESGCSGLDRLLSFYANWINEGCGADRCI